MTIWFRSDDHFNHAKVMQMRGFTDMAGYNEFLVGLHNERVRPDDIVWFHGDISMGKSDTEALELVARMNGRKQLITGNHDAVFPGHRDARKHQRKWLEVFESVQAYARIKISGQEFLLSHFPYHGDHTEPTRYSQYRLKDEGKWLIHGHVHSDKRLWGERQVHVGLDAWNLEPVKDTDVLAIVWREERKCEVNSQ